MSAPGARTGSYRWGILGLLMALCFISHFSRASIATAADTRVMEQFGISPQKMGVVYSAYLLVYTLFMIPGGLLTDRWGARRALLVMGLGAALFGAFTGGLGLLVLTGAQLWLGLLVVRSIMGMTNTPLHPGCARAVADWFPAADRSFANGLVTSAALLAYAFVHPIFGFLIDRLDWPLAFMSVAAVAAVVAAIWFRISARRPAAADSTATTMVCFEQKWWRNRSLIFLTLSYAAVGYFQYLFFYWMHYYFSTVLQLGEIKSRFYASLPSLAMAVAMPLGGWLSDRAIRVFGARGRPLVPATGMILSGVVLAFGIISHDVRWMVTWFTLSLAILGLCEGSFWTTAVEIGGDHGATTAAIMNTGGNGIGLLAPLLTPIISARLSWQWGIGVGAIVAFLGGLCWLCITPNHARPAPIAPAPV